MKKKVSILVVLMVIFGLLVSGCGNSTPSSAPSAGNAGSSGSAGGTDKLVLGVPTALGTIEGQTALNSIKMAVEEINGAGGVEVKGKKYQFEVASIDTREAEAGVPVNDALSAVTKLMTEKKPYAIVGGSFRSEVFLAEMDLLAPNKIPYIDSIAMTPDFEKKIQGDYNKYKYYFRTAMNAPGLVDYISKVMGYIGKKYNYNKIYFMYQDVAWAKGSATGVQAWATKNGWTVVGSDSYATGNSDFSTSLSKAKAGGAQIIVPIFDMPESGALVKQAKSMGVNALMAGYISPASTGTGWTTFNGQIDGLINFIYEAGPIPLKNIPQSVKYNEAYGKKYGADALQKLPGHGASPAYDAVYVLADALKRANSLDSDAVVAALEKTDLVGAIGKIKFNKDHQVIFGEDPTQTASGLAFQWRAGKRVVIFPEAAAEGQIELPAK